jgi:hypothetical protein
MDFSLASSDYCRLRLIEIRIRADAVLAGARLTVSDTIDLWWEVWALSDMALDALMADVLGTEQ